MSRHTVNDTKLWRALRADVKQHEPLCWLCLKPWDPDAKPKTDWAFSVDHVLPASTHRELRYVRSNLRAAHYACNRNRGNRPARPAGQAPAAPPLPVTSRDW